MYRVELELDKVRTDISAYAGLNSVFLKVKVYYDHGDPVSLAGSLTVEEGKHYSNYNEFTGLMPELWLENGKDTPLSKEVKKAASMYARGLRRKDAYINIV